MGESGTAQGVWRLGQGKMPVYPIGVRHGTLWLPHPSWILVQALYGVPCGEILQGVFLRFPGGDVGGPTAPRKPLKTPCSIYPHGTPYEACTSIHEGCGNHKVPWRTPTGYTGIFPCPRRHTPCAVPERFRTGPLLSWPLTASCFWCVMCSTFLYIYRIIGFHMGSKKPGLLFWYYFIAG